MSTLVELIKRVEDLNVKAKKRDSRIFAFDDFHPKEIPSGANDEVSFLYLILNLYALFYDSGRYILDLNLFGKDDHNLIKKYYFALNEVRSVFCHNKTSDSYLGYRIANRHLDKLVSNWFSTTCFCRIDLAAFESNNSWRDLYDLFNGGAEAVIDIVDKKLSTSLSPAEIEQWFTAIANWYLKSDEVILRALYSYCLSNETMPGPWNDYKQDKKAYPVQRYLAYKYVEKQQIKDAIGKLRESYSESPQDWQCWLLSYLYSPLKDDELTPLSLLSPFLENVFRSQPLPQLPKANSQN